MFTTSHTRGTLATVAGGLLASWVLAGCGQESAVGVRSGDAEESADSIVQDAERYVGDPMEQRAREEYWRKHQLGSERLRDSWERQLLEEHGSR
ncbi:MAG: hypothetical protein ACRDPR_06750 [Nocardioidaceae bacterium]